jgi:hypothetical protein
VGIGNKGDIPTQHRPGRYDDVADQQQLADEQYDFVRPVIQGPDLFQRFEERRHKDSPPLKL